MVIPTEFDDNGIWEYVFPMADVRGDQAFGWEPYVTTYVRGTVESIEELVGNSGEYRVKLWFTDLKRHSYAPPNNFWNNT
jgi:hypothetical protein